MNVVASLLLKVELLYGADKAVFACTTNPHLLLIDDVIEDSPAPAEEYLLELGISQAALKRIRSAYPHFLLLSVERVLRGRVEYLTSVLGSASAAARTIGRYPNVLGLDVEANVRSYSLSARTR